MIDVEDRTQEAQTGVIRREQAVSLLALAMLEMKHAEWLVRGSLAQDANDAQRMLSHREATRCLKRLDDLVREAEDTDPTYIRSSAVVLMLKNEVVGLRSKIRAVR